MRAGSSAPCRMLFYSNVLNHHRLLMLPSYLAHLPAPPAEALASSAELQKHIRSAIGASGGWISFARFMELALYAPGLGYYSAGSTKLGAAGDFVTAPELSPLFARCVARQVAQLVEGGIYDVIEVGAGSGALARDLLQTLAALERLPERYLILELSADLRERQRQRIAGAVPELIERVQWLDTMPVKMDAIVIGNEVLDAVPTHIVRTRSNGYIEEAGVGINARDDAFERIYRPASGGLLAAAQALELPTDYEAEINLTARALVTGFAQRVERGALLFCDYGFPAAEYYHPQRFRGTLMCHYRHHAHDNPLVLVGLQDITTHVDFTAVADAAIDAGHTVLGYATQAQFLINCGITDLLAACSVDEARAWAPLAAAAQKLLSPAEMGELFKVLALGRGVDVPLVGFTQGDRAHTL
jgi:SAM-dependent MidA family methyltransferase